MKFLITKNILETSGTTIANFEIKVCNSDRKVETIRMILEIIEGKI
jgi:hypothetical protein